MLMALNSTRLFFLIQQITVICYVSRYIGTDAVEQLTHDNDLKSDDHLVAYPTKRFAADLPNGMVRYPTPKGRQPLLGR
jgi:hypothetical protein